MLKVFEYEQHHKVTFDYSNGELMINATEMARPFGKTPKDFLRTNSTKQYIEAFVSRQKCLLKDIVNVINGGRHNGTWMHRKLALRFAQWLSPEFALWVDEQIEELLTKGKVKLSSMSRFDLMRSVIDAMEENNKRINVVEQKVQRVEAKVTNINTDYYALSGYYVLRGRRFDLTKVEAQQYGKKLTKASALNGHIVRKTYHEKYGSVNTYHTDVLKAVLGF